MSFEVDVTEVSQGVLLLELSSPWSTVAPDYEDVLQAHRSAFVPGFRVGKAPLPVIKAHFHKDICSDAARRAATRLARDAVRERKLRVARGMVVTEMVLIPGQDFHCKVRIFQRPEFTPPAYHQITIPDMASMELNARYDAIADWLLSNTEPFSLPEPFIDELLDGDASTDETARVSAAQQARLQIIAREIAEREGLDVSPELMASQLDDMAKDEGISASSLRKQLEGNGGIEGIRDFLLTKVVLDYLCEISSGISSD